MSERPKYQLQIEERIAEYPYGTAFSASDFLDIADANWSIASQGSIK